MNETKRQHFVPATYLSGWDLSSPISRRDASIWWTDGKLINKSGVTKIGLQRHFYAQKNTHISEGYFGEFEGDWSNLVEKLESPIPSKHFLMGCLLQAIVMSIRNPSLKFEKGTPRFAPTVRAIDTFLQKILHNGKAIKNPREMSNALHEQWQMHVFLEPEPAFMTSDNPSTLLRFQDDQVSAVLLPISPTAFFVAVRKSKLNIYREVLLKKEVAAANSYVVVNSNRMVFSYEEIETEKLESINFLQSTNRHLGELGETTMRLSTLQFPIDALQLPITSLPIKLI